MNKHSLGLGIFCVLMGSLAAFTETAKANEPIRIGGSVGRAPSPHAPARPAIRITLPARGVPHGHPLASNEMLVDWLGGTKVLTLARLQRLVNLAGEDPEAKALVARAMEEFGAQTVEQFMALFEVAIPESADGSEMRVVAGEFTPGDWDVQVKQFEPSEYFEALNAGVDLSQREPYKSWIETRIADKHAYINFVEIRSTLFRLNTYVGPKVRLPAQSNLADAYETFMHELAHFVRFSPQAEPDPTLYETIDDYEAALIAMPGQEVDARLYGIRALTRLVGDVPYRTSLPVSSERWFSPTGSFLRTPEELVSLLRGYMGYRFDGVYENRLEMMRLVDNEERMYLKQALDMSRRVGGTPEGGTLDSMPSSATQLDWRKPAQERLQFLEERMKTIDRLSAQVNSTSGS